MASVGARRLVVGDGRASPARARPTTGLDQVSQSQASASNWLGRWIHLSIDRYARINQSTNRSSRSIDSPHRCGCLPRPMSPFCTHDARPDRRCCIARRPVPAFSPYATASAGRPGRPATLIFGSTASPWDRSIQLFRIDRMDASIPPKHSLCLTRSPHTTTHTTFHSGTKAGSWARRTRACRPPVQQQRGGGRRAVAACVRKDGGRRDGGLAAQARADGHG